jgi:hypothetical protein
MLHTLGAYTQLIITFQLCHVTTLLRPNWRPLVRVRPFSPDPFTERGRADT